MLTTAKQFLCDGKAQLHSSRRNGLHPANSAEARANLARREKYAGRRSINESSAAFWDTARQLLLGTEHERTRRLDQLVAVFFIGVSFARLRDQLESVASKRLPPVCCNEAPFWAEPEVDEDLVTMESFCVLFSSFYRNTDVAWTRL